MKYVLSQKTMLNKLRSQKSAHANKIRIQNIFIKNIPPIIFFFIYFSLIPIIYPDITEKQNKSIIKLTRPFTKLYLIFEIQDLYEIRTEHLVRCSSVNNEAAVTNL